MHPKSKCTYLQYMAAAQKCAHVHAHTPKVRTVRTVYSQILHMYVHTATYVFSQTLAPVSEVHNTYMTYSCTHTHTRTWTRGGQKLLRSGLGISAGVHCWKQRATKRAVSAFTEGFLSPRAATMSSSMLLKEVCEASSGQPHVGWHIRTYVVHTYIYKYLQYKYAQYPTYTDIHIHTYTYTADYCN